PKKQRTFVAVKHDGVQRGLVGEIIHRIERTGLKIVAIKMFVPTMEKTVEHYGKDDTWCEKVGNRTIEELKNQNKEITKSAVEYGKDVLNALYKYFTLGPIVGFIVEGNSSVAIVKKLVGGTEPTTSDVGTIRGDFTLDSYELSNVDGRAVRNLMHCSDKPEEAEREINIWFKPEEIINYRHIQEEILYDVNIDGILE
ncbi:MAG: nucleoside-diphosphate kinase, partial [Minisyncoccia bacterium]